MQDLHNIITVSMERLYKYSNIMSTIYRICLLFYQICYFAAGCRDAGYQGGGNRGAGCHNAGSSNTAFRMPAVEIQTDRILSAEKQAK